MDELLPYLPALLAGLWFTFVLVACSALAGTLLGLVLGLCASGEVRLLRWLGNLYTSIVRGVPPLIILFFMYFALPIMFPVLSLSPLVTGIIALSIYASAYMAEIVRGAIRAVPQGQREAADAIGMDYYLKTRYIVLPEAMQVAVAPGISFLISLVKASALASVIGVMELTAKGHIISTLNDEPLTVFLAVAVLYFIVSYPLALLGRWYEGRYLRS